jgi:hypothetical protein
MTEKECLQILGLEREYTSEQLKEAHRTLAQVWHPDRFQQNEKLRKRSEREMQRINEAVQTLNSKQFTYSETPHKRKTSPPPPSKASKRSTQPPPKTSYREKTPPPIPKETPEEIAKNKKAKLKLEMKSATKTFYWLGGICWLIIIIAQKDHKESDPANPIAGYATLILIAYWIWYANKRKKIKNDIGMK